MALHTISGIPEILAMIFGNLNHPERKGLWGTCRFWCTIMRDTPPVEITGLTEMAMAGPWYTRARQEWISYLCDSSSVLSVLIRLDPSQIPVTYPPAVCRLRSMIMDEHPEAEKILRYLDTSDPEAVFATPDPDILARFLGNVDASRVGNDTILVPESLMRNPWSLGMGSPESKRTIGRWLVNNGLLGRYYRDVLHLIGMYYGLDTDYAIAYVLIRYFPYLIEVLPRRPLGLSEDDRKQLVFCLVGFYAQDTTLSENIARYIYAEPSEH